MDADKQRRLAEAAQDGDEEAWELLYRSVFPRLHAYAVRRVGLAVAEDVVNETMARAVAGIGRFRWQAPGFDGWLFGIARRVCANHHRSAGRERRRAGWSQDPVSASSPDEAHELAEDHAQIRRVFDRLSPADQELLELRVIAGLSADQVAGVLGKRAGAVRTAQSRALNHLRRLLQQEDR